MEKRKKNVNTFFFFISANKSLSLSLKMFLLYIIHPQQVPGRHGSFYIYIFHSVKKVKTLTKGFAYVVVKPTHCLCACALERSLCRRLGDERRMLHLALRRRWVNWNTTGMEKAEGCRWRDDLGDTFISVSKHFKEDSLRWPAADRGQH